MSVRIQSECGKIRTRKNSVFGHGSRSGCTPTDLHEAPPVAPSICIIPQDLDARQFENKSVSIQGIENFWFHTRSTYIN